MNPIVEDALWLWEDRVPFNLIAERVGVQPRYLREVAAREGIYFDTPTQARTRRLVNRLIAEGREIRGSIMPEWACRDVYISVTQQASAAGLIRAAGTKRSNSSSHYERVFEVAA